MRRDTGPGSRLARVVAVALVCAVVVAVVPAGTPVRAQSDAGTVGSGGPDASERRCLPDGGRNLTIGDGDPHIDLTIHTSLFTDPSPPSALGLSARGVAVGAEIVRLRTGVMIERVPDGLSVDAVWDSLVVLFDYRLSLPMFTGAVDDPAYDPDGGPVSGVETRQC
jgi:hypothetical protein